MSPPSLLGLADRLLELNALRVQRVTLGRLIHDARTPLNALHLNLELLRMKCDSGDSDLRGMVTQLKADCARLATSLEDLSRPVGAVGPGSLPDSACPLSVIESWGAYARHRGCAVNIVPPSSCPHGLPAHHISHLIGSAVLNVTGLPGDKPSLLLSLEIDGASCQIKIQDGGPGLSQEQAGEFLTDPWLRPHPGIGLWCIATLCERLNGNLSVDSGSSGTSLGIRLPLSPIDD